MSVETTQFITRQEAIERILSALAAKIAKIHAMSDTELDDLLYALTRDTNYFDNFSIREAA